MIIERSKRRYQLRVYRDDGTFKSYGWGDSFLELRTKLRKLPADARIVDNFTGVRYDMKGARHD